MILVIEKVEHENTLINIMPNIFLRISCILSIVFISILHLLLPAAIFYVPYTPIQIYDLFFFSYYCCTHTYMHVKYSLLS